MPVKLNYVKGQILNNLTFIKEVERTGTKRKALWMCYCGKKFYTTFDSVRSKKTSSCGCYAKKCNLTKSLVHGDSVKTSPYYYLYHLWSAIKNRCYNKKNADYPLYGGNGIIMYETWIKNYPSFKHWILNNLGDRPKGYSIHRRPNLKGNYEPGNIVWASNHIQRLEQNPRKLVSNWVYYHKRENAWKASVYLRTKTLHVGTFTTKEEAIEARKQFIITNNIELN